MQRIERGIELGPIRGVAFGFAARDVIAGDTALLRLLFELVEQSHGIPRVRRRWHAFVRRMQSI